jgi:hypothetical protein
MEGFKYDYVPLNEDVLVLAGDIHTMCRHRELFDQVPDHIQIIFVPGNHEYYRSEFHEVNRYFRELQGVMENFTYLENDSFSYKDVEFFGGTMYTDFGLYGESQKVEAEAMADRGINDFYASQILDEGTPYSRMWSTKDHLKEHSKFCYELEGWIKSTEGKKRVVVSHFVPSPQAVHPRWGQNMLNPYFTADMERFMGWEGLWLYGHTHDSSDFMVGDTRCVGNPRGYGKENAHGFENERILEI